ncbi:hypothetical protein [Thermus tengchongensis]|uniref:hypothetical protein n=1 Tax=Thermus tengchongensis TaxID=1214928 RepID=UPI000B01E857|nr:hypothetical protein [Thermus tengchongensis]
MLGWVREVLAGMAEGALPGETRAVWEREGDGEVGRTEGYALTSLGPDALPSGQTH